MGSLVKVTSEKECRKPIASGKYSYEVHYKNRQNESVEICYLKIDSFFVSQRPNITINDFMAIKDRELNGFRKNLWVVNGVFRVED